MSGKKVEIPQAINRIVVTCYGGAAHEIAVLGGAEKIVAQPSTKSFPQFYKMYPHFTGMPDVGSFDAVDVERIVMLRPEIVVGSVTAMQGNRKIASAGIPVIAVSTGRADINRLLREIQMMGVILGNEEKAAALVQYWNDSLSRIRKRIGPIPQTLKKKVFYTSSGSGLTTERELGWGHYFITASGGVNVSAGLQLNGEITPEQLLVWNPDVIITRSRNEASRRIIRDDARLKNVKALKANAVYQCPVGAFWWDRPSPEAILGIFWLAKTLYPEAMRAMDLKRETVSFYKTFYGHELTGPEYEAFFSER